MQGKPEFLTDYIQCLQFELTGGQQQMQFLSKQVHKKMNILSDFSSHWLCVFQLVWNVFFTSQHVASVRINRKYNSESFFIEPSVSFISFEQFWFFFVVSRFEVQTKENRLVGIWAALVSKIYWKSFRYNPQIK